MPGRNDFGILRSEWMSDDRSHRAAALFVERGLAVEGLGLATVAGLVVQLGVWAMRETDDGILPGDGVTAMHVATLIPRLMCRIVLDALCESGLTRATATGIYLVGFRDCYSAVLDKREENREKARKKRAKSRGDVSGDVPGYVPGYVHDDVPGDVPVDDSSSGSESSVSGDVPGYVPGYVEDHRTVPYRTVPLRTEPTPPSSATTNGGGDSSASPSSGNGTAANDADPLSPEDEAVATTIIRLLRASGDPGDSAKAEQAFSALRERVATPTQARAFIDRFTARFPDDVTKTRRPFAMARNGRKKDKSP